MAKMTAVERKAFYMKALDEQKHLLEQRIRDMKEGDLIAALQVASVVRTLVHETGASKPLLKNLTTNYLQLPITLPKIPKATNPPGMSSITFFHPVSAKLTAPEGKIALMTEPPPQETQEESAIGAWWSAIPCAILPAIGPVTRKEMILGLSNKEGGTHVDADISEKYQALLASKFFSFGIAGKSVEPLNLSRLGAGRIGLELLDSIKKNFPMT